MYLIFDIGGTHTRLAVSEDNQSLTLTTIRDTPQSFAEGMTLIQKTAAEITHGKTIEAVAGDVAGPLSQDKSYLVNAPHLKDWIKKPLKEELEKRLNAPVYLENDAALVGLGEAMQGSGKDHAIVMYMTVSTGVGGARIVDGKIDKNAMGFEPGHQIIDINGPLCPTCNIPGHLESYISGAALKKKYGKKPEDISDKYVWDDVAYYLAFGIHNSLLHWSPDVIVLGGSMMKSISLDKVTENLHKILTIFPKVPLLKRAELDDRGGLYGALSMAQNI